MAFKVTEQWDFGGLKVLQLDKAKTVKSAREDYRYYRIGNIVYKPVPMSRANENFIAINASGNFVGKEVEFLKEEPLYQFGIGN